ncbi:MAG: hypothetical protein MZV63_70850 [Marinilabiliales bacterium]|nr:hypothetical protein [Marinilabiliales bacterium]
MAKKTGVISQVIGPVVDVTFETAGTEMPNILDALEITRQDGTVLVVECQQHIGEKDCQGNSHGLNRRTAAGGWRLWQQVCRLSCLWANRYGAG